MSYSHNRICVDLQSGTNCFGSYGFNDPAARRDRTGIVYARRGKVRNAYSGDRPDRAEHNYRGTTDKPRKKNGNKKIIPLIVIIASALMVGVGSIFVIKYVVKSNSGANDTKVTESRSKERETKATNTAAESEKENINLTEITETTPTSETTKETTPPKTGWQGSDTIGWRYFPYPEYPDAYYHDNWYEINGKWYYFNSDGYMERKCYRDGYWINEDGTRDSDSPTGEWKENDDGKWYEAAGWYPSNMGLWIDGEYYWFDSDGFWDPEVKTPEEAAALRAAAEAEDEDDDED